MNGRQKNTVAIGLFWMVSLGIVFVLGILSAFAFHLKPGSDPGAGGASLEERDMALLYESFTGQQLDLAVVMTPSGNQLAEPIEQLLRAILREQAPELRSTALLRLARSLPTRQLMAGIRTLMEMPASAARNEGLAQFLKRWGNSDGRSAVAFATAIPNATDRDLALAAVLHGWSRARPREAWSWVVERFGTPRRAQPWLRIILLNLQQVDRPQAIELLHALPVSTAQDDLAAAMVEGLLETLPTDNVLSWLAEFPPSSFAAAGTTLAINWARSDPPSAAAWLLGALPMEMDAMEQVLREWVYRSPQPAADWVWSHFDGNASLRYMEIIAAEWIAVDGPSPLAQWLNTNGPSPSLDGAIEALAVAAAEFDPATALVWAQSLHDGERRTMLEIFIGRQWQLDNPNEADSSLPLMVNNPTVLAALFNAERTEFENAAAAAAEEPAYEPVSAAPDMLPAEPLPDDSGDIDDTSADSQDLPADEEPLDPVD